MLPKNNFSCIYKITCLKSKRYYIGSACNYHRRKWNHLNSLKHNKHANRFLQRVFNKYGIENLFFEVQEIVENKNDLLVRE